MIHHNTMTNPLHVCCYCIIAILIALNLHVGHAVKTANKVRSPFRVVWNYPDGPCLKHKVHFDLAKYGIITNNVRGNFVGNEIATLYSSTIGLWPWYSNGNPPQPLNGGIPQLANLTAHLEKLRSDIAWKISEDATGYGVIDQEEWRVFDEMNYHKKIYKSASVEYMRGKNPQMTNEQVKKASPAAFEASAKEMMLKSLQVAQAVRPNMHWGYYLYPQYWWTDSSAAYYNNRMGWVYKASTGIYPSIYIKFNEHHSRDSIYDRIKNTVREAIRVRETFNNRTTPVIPYTVIQNGDNLFNKTILDLAIGLPADMGVDGLVIWGTFWIFKYNTYKNCIDVKNYVNNVFGPYVKELTDKLTDCSVTKCGSKGLCVKKNWARSTSSVVPPQKGTVDIYEDYVCQCYSGSNEPFC